MLNTWADVPTEVLDGWITFFEKKYPIAQSNKPLSATDIDKINFERGQQSLIDDLRNERKSRARSA